MGNTKFGAQSVSMLWITKLWLVQKNKDHMTLLCHISYYITFLVHKCMQQKAYLSVPVDIQGISPTIWLIFNVNILG